MSGMNEKKPETLGEALNELRLKVADLKRTVTATPFARSVLSLLDRFEDSYSRNAWVRVTTAVFLATFFVVFFLLPMLGVSLIAVTPP